MRSTLVSSLAAIDFAVGSISMRVVLLVALAGCKAIFGLDDPGTRIDAGPDPNVDARLCWGTDVSVCLSGPPTGEYSPSVIDTGGGDCDPGVTDYCVVAGIDVKFNGNVAVTGPRPLIAIALGTLEVNGTLDAAGHLDAAGPGAGTPSAMCNSFASSPSSHGGGAGGTFRAVGGNGGGNTEGGTGGSTADVLSLAFRAGCVGQDGGLVTQTMFGHGGGGGGAVYLIAGIALNVPLAGKVNVSGGGGRGGQCTPAPCDSTETDNVSAGGGGGGAGGIAILEAPSISVDGLVFADGGGGGQGASRRNDGTDGADPNGSEPAIGGTIPGSMNHGGPGGTGAHATSAATIGLEGNANPAGAGGGGGGGAGATRAHGTLTNTGTISPDPS